MDKQKEYQEKFNKKHPDCHKKYLERFNKKHPNYHKDYYQQHREQLILKAQNYYQINREKIISYARTYQKKCCKNNPCRKVLRNIRQRCYYQLDKKYKYYGGRGIKCFLTLMDLKFLWQRDKAAFMKQPSIDRIDNTKHYVLNNCRFIEMKENRERRYYLTVNDL